MTSDRDLVGYGPEKPDIRWPDGNRVAISLVVNFEEGAELQVGDGDPVSERVGEVLSVVREGVRDRGQEQIFAYGMRAGLWRFLDALRRHDVPATFLMCGRAVERVPDLAGDVVAAGHEPACHGWRWRPHADYADEASERNDLIRCNEVIKAATGTRPRGFFCRGGESAWTRKLLAEQGYVYAANAFDDDLPYWDDSGLVVLPYALDSNDMKFFHPNGFVRPADFSTYVIDAIEQLRVEASRGRSSMLTVGFHLRITGRPARFRAVEAILDRLDDLRDDVWIARRIDIARHFGTVFPNPTKR
jgi:peptidoglycan/xylan/chitin deacetylase (PgdA/CDA1 family)